MKTLLIVLLTVLVLANLTMFIVTAWFKRNKGVKSDKASRIGFTVMCCIFACNIIAILGGMICFV